MFTNKHVIVALIVAPILAVISYLAIDRLVAEKAHMAKSGSSYPLAAKSSCRYASGECLLVNGDLQVMLRAGKSTETSIEILLHSSVPIDGAKVAITSRDEVVAEDDDVAVIGGDGEPVSFESSDLELHDWVVRLAYASIDEEQLRLVVSHDGALFYAQINALFLHGEGSDLAR